MNNAEIFEPFLRRLRVSTEIDEEDEAAIRHLPITVKRMPGGQPVVSLGDRPSACCLVVDGFILRSKIVGNGHRQIMAFHQPGDIPDLQGLFLHVMDHDVSTLGDSVLGFIPHAAVRSLIRKRPNVAEALWRDTLTDAAIFREWICNVGQREATSRVAHLVLELYTRLKAIGRADGLSFDFPASQALLADAVGTSVVHMNRVVQQLRAQRVLDLERGRISILDEARLREIADFDVLYLHLNPSL
ncbi:Crp/Fnr family transcriptional regulator [Bradyrhizobium sp. 193]|uniref:Crp/Fnr family transcriptional regulator n=1 Tax=unclassified Bradyrhizobium TaxID=2631580 RepID=UPI001FFA13FC|nr:MULTISPECIES: Crp/Fnr family transcriptional regulator [unclassified Bradyrhizobium]MCK1343930.1 Crp/Fnr family transcriptional regulator [Bradyrhizobium sp. CW11]MCK1467095.1 Crp/Fnr family transcriptional regulator [Bradyrhizobium sp. CW10]MCK1486208.1 Crp/Fnr family transcriptional regulator [Bradyrhizobium sp. 193]MCK1583212.1 Crp/Fnr family transcriptional regulator [Bradyrhizobium sp. 168]MCK1676583.1 Crp/Fnr family transcriptional regulator [Bradyrhizobium sp. 150]